VGVGMNAISVCTGNEVGEMVDQIQNEHDGGGCREQSEREGRYGRSEQKVVRVCIWPGPNMMHTCVECGPRRTVW
jgi:hypothetical protein